MSRRNSHPQKRRDETQVSRWRTAVAITLILILIAASGILAYRPAFRVAATSYKAVNQPLASPVSLSPTDPSKEYIYAGSKLIATEQPMFNDVLMGSQFYDFIVAIAEKGVTAGCGGGSYCPASNVTREQMAAFIIRALGIFNPPTNVPQRFADVPPSNQFYGFIDQMAARGITSGCGGGNYCPQNNVTREQMAAFIMRALGIFNPDTNVPQRFLDVPPFLNNDPNQPNPFYGFIDQMAARGITSGCGGGNYCPSDFVTREQMAAFLVKAFNL